MFEFTVPVIVTSIVLLLVRIIITATFFNESWAKFKDIKKFSKNDGVPVPLAYFVATAELAAALGMLTGVLAQWAGVGVVLLMCGTLSLQIFKWHSPYWAAKRGWEYDLIMLVLAAIIAVYGPGQFVLF
ncbi:DoxX family protein [Candidatus Saccharibacteria bacterium RAAC3_TM7_1]|nr:DoxX family protein [Candidatus Saccharibacteria bacterium RAAC3_TM7_1]